MGVVGPVISGVFLYRNTRLAVAAERQRARLAAIQQVLDHGAELMARYRAVMGGVTAGKDAGRVEIPAGFDETIRDVTIFRERLLLWFDEKQSIVHAYDSMLSLTVWTSELIVGTNPDQLPPEMIQAAQPELTESLLEDLEHARQRYLTAAREYLAGAPSGS